MSLCPGAPYTLSPTIGANMRYMHRQLMGTAGVGFQLDKAMGAIVASTLYMVCADFPSRLRERAWFCGISADW